MFLPTSRTKIEIHIKLSFATRFGLFSMNLYYPKPSIFQWLPIICSKVEVSFWGRGSIYALDFRNLNHLSFIVTRYRTRNQTEKKAIAKYNKEDSKPGPTQQQDLPKLCL
jgi:hypothetical protein